MASNVWRSEVPSSWKVTKIKYIAQLINGDRGENYPSGNDFVDTGIPFITSYDLNDRYIINVKKHITVEKYALLRGIKIKKDDIIYCLRGSVGKNSMAVSSHGTIASSLMGVRVNKKILAKYLLYVLNSEIELLNRGKYTTGSVSDNLSAENVAEYIIPLPQIDQQTKIINYLDKKVDEVELIIQKKINLISLLEQQRQSIITEAVTKGLNPNVKMKDSGVEWIGEMPEHWEVKKVKHFATHVGSGKTPSGGSEVYLDEGVPFLRSLNVHFDGIRLKDLAFISEETNAEMRHSQVKPLDILLNITGASIGRTVLVPKDFGRANVNQHVCIIRLNQNKVYPYYFNIIMSSDVINQQIWFAQNGSSREGLNFVQVKELTFAIPPTLEEQREINEWIFNKQKGIFEIIASVKVQIEKLKEYRQALIYEAVTGKIDVRELELD